MFRSASRSGSILTIGQAGRWVLSANVVSGVVRRRLSMSKSLMKWTFVVSMSQK
jgi:hypothetical protein